MAEKKIPSKRSSAKPKQEMLEAYDEALKELQEKREAGLRPEERIEERKAKKAVDVADALSTEGIVKGIANLKSEIGKMFTQLSDRLEEEVDKYAEIKKAIESKEKELQEIYEIQKSASALVALIETHHQKREEFEAELAARKQELTREIESVRAEWEKEKKLHEAEIKERDAAELKRREREKEEYRYAFAREQQLAKDKFDDEKFRLEREIQLKKEQMERELAEKERVLAGKEEELNELGKKVAAFPKEMETAVSKAVKEATDRLQLEAKNREELMKKEFAGEKNVLTTRIASLEQTIKEQSEQIAKLSSQTERASIQVQDIALKALEASSNFKSFTSMQQLLTEQTRKQSQEK